MADLTNKGLDLFHATEPLRLGVDAANYTGFQTDAAGNLTATKTIKLPILSLGANPTILEAGTERGRIVGGVLAWGTAVTVGAAAGEAVLANVKALRGVNAAGTGTVSMLYLASDDVINMGNASHYLDVRFYDEGTAAGVIKRVRLGAVDSGGTGFRTLIVPN